MKEFIKKIKEKKELKIYFVIALLGFIICLPFLRIHLATDSYNMAKPKELQYIFQSVSGRPISDLVLMYTEVIGFGMMKHQQVYTFISILIMIWSTILLFNTCKKITEDNMKSAWIVGISALMIIFNTFGMEMFLFNVMFSLSIQYLLIVYSVKILVDDFNLKNTVIAVLINLIGMCIYQAISPMFIALSLILLGYKNRDKKFLKNVWIYFKIGIIYGLAGIGNLMIMKIPTINRYSESTSTIKDNVISLLGRQELLWKDTYGFFPRNFFLSICIILFIFALILIIIYKRKSFINLLTSLLGAIVVTIIAAYIPHVISSTWIVPRTALTISMIPGFIILFMGLHFADMNYSYKMIVTLIACLYILLSINTAVLLVDKLVRTNYYDKQITDNVMEIIDNYEEKTGIKVKKISFAPDAIMCWEHPQLQNKIMGLDVYIKAFNTPWSRESIFEYYYGREFEQVEMDEQVYNDNFKDKNWDSYSDEQVVIINDTVYIAVF